jgi:hypothetical protein
MRRNTPGVLLDSGIPSFVPALVFQDLLFVEAWIAVLRSSDERVNRRLLRNSERFSRENEHGGNPM